MRPLVQSQLSSFHVEKKIFYVFLQLIIAVHLAGQTILKKLNYMIKFHKRERGNSIYKYPEISGKNLNKRIT